ncbi:mannose-1-phosphate guanylyltransferase [Pedobacter sp. PLR]|uniref:mannose-1-phosphate guanylyltransferase n=1 Tax=Pedobacter sp. PLR TaxID=2994465 RepID=UPI002245C88D|nr:mannose-1-phosphate guanylyltransferase [Pedobacter sp. PLR]MCX2453363.1 mannose-1-phosphate guanylyltransferase [Pedobacter sp. PLR]
MSNINVLIMAGGVGSRFWPKSRNSFPKQFIDILGVGKSLLQLTYDRFLNICPAENIYILSNEQYKDLINNQIPGLNEQQILLEPSRNNTAPCIAYACYKIMQLNPEANIVVAPSDHLILKEVEFLTKIKEALDFTAENNALLTLGIKPTRPDTGYGYVNFNKTSANGIHKVERFMEKPVLEKAKEFVESGDYLWNAGIFIWSGSAIKQAFKKYAPDIDAIFDEGSSHYNTDSERSFLAQNYSKSPNISIDYAVLEKADNVYTIPADIGWSDLGTWASLHAVAEKDANQNSLNCSEVSLNLTENCIINLPAGKAAVIKGLKDYIIVDDEKVLLIYPKSDEQEIKEVAKNMADNFGNQYL